MREFLTRDDDHDLQAHVDINWSGCCRHGNVGRLSSCQCRRTDREPFFRLKPLKEWRT